MNTSLGEKKSKWLMTLQLSKPEATGMSLGAAVRALVAAGGAGALFGGATARGVSLAGSLFVMPLTLRTAERFGL